MKLLRVDWIDGFLFIAGMTIFLVGLSWAGVQFAWTSYFTLVPTIFGLAGVGVTLLWERFNAQEPFLRLSLFHKGSAIAAYICAFMQGWIVSFPMTINFLINTWTPGLTFLPAVI
jgi:hypothetical protein